MITIDDNAGFCYGVQRAVDTAFDAASLPGEVWCLGKLIHNDDCMKRLSEMNIRVANSVSEIPSNAYVIIRAHGEPQSTYDELAAKDCKIIDATCRFVEKIHKIAKNKSDEGCIIIIIGDRDHPEVRGILGYCTEGHTVADVSDIPCLFDAISVDKKVCVVTQTTAGRKNAENIVAILKKHYTNCEIFDTICNATSRRQSSAAELAAKCDGMIVIGGKDSSNTRRLFDVCRELCENTVMVENAEELKADRFAGCKHIGITAGASTPAWIIKEVHSKL